MRKLLMLVSVVTLLAAVSCVKDDSGEVKCVYTDPVINVPAAEVQAVEAYLSSQSITNATKDSRGFYYRITTPGTGTVTPTVCSQIRVNYVGRFTNGNIFDQTTGTPATFYLGQVIAGWIKGIPLIKSGGKITLYLPPSLGYGSTTIGPIPGNSILIFDVELVSIIE